MAPPPERILAWREVTKRPWAEDAKHLVNQESRQPSKTTPKLLPSYVDRFKSTSARRVSA